MGDVSPEELLVGQNRKTGRARGFVAAGDRRRIEVFAQHAARGACLLDLGDDRGLPCAHRGYEIARLRRRARARFDAGEWRALLRRGDLHTLHLEDALEDGHFFVCLLKAMNSSILCFAAPPLMAWLARSMPAFRFGASPAT